MSTLIEKKNIQTKFRNMFIKLRHMLNFYVVINRTFRGDFCNFNMLLNLWFIKIVCFDRYDYIEFRINIGNHCISPFYCQMGFSRKILKPPVEDINENFQELGWNSTGPGGMSKSVEKTQM